MYLCPGNGSLQRRYTIIIIIIEVISIRGSKFLGDAPRIFLINVDCVLRTLPGVLPLLPSPFANMLAASGPYQSKTAATSGCALHIILCTDACRHISQTHTRTLRERDAYYIWRAESQSGLTHEKYIIHSHIPIWLLCVSGAADDSCFWKIYNSLYSMYNFYLIFGHFS